MRIEVELIDWEEYEKNKDYKVMYFGSPACKVEVIMRNDIADKHIKNITTRDVRRKSAISLEVFK